MTNANVTHMVQRETTPVDHQALARYYDARTHAAEHEAALDREIRGRYERRWRRSEGMT